MASGFQHFELQRFGLAIDKGVSSYDPPAEDKQTETETQSTPFGQRFSGLTLDELSDELERRTKETQKLQEEVENATRKTMKRFGYIYGNSSSGLLSHNSHEQAVTQRPVCSLDTLNQKDRSTCKKATLENVMDNFLQHLDKTDDQSEQDHRAIMNLQNKLHEVQMDKDVLSDLRLKDSRKRVHQLEKMLCMLKDLQNIKRSTDQKLQETKDEALELHRKVESLEQSIKEVYKTLYDNQCGNICTNAGNSQAQGVHVNDDLSKEPDILQKRIFSSKGQQGCEEYNKINQQERIEDLITSLGQEMAMLTDKLSLSKTSGIGTAKTVSMSRKLAEKRTSLYDHQISELESNLFSYNDKVCRLEQKILEAQTQLVNTQRERERSLQQAKELQSELSQLKTHCEQQELELRENAEVLRRQLEVARKELCKAGEEKTCLQALLEQKDQEMRNFQELLQEKEEELCCMQKQTQQHLVSLEDAHSHCQTLQAEQETLRLKLNDGEKVIDVLRLQIESSVQETEQHRHTIDSLQQENSLLIYQLDQHKLEIQQLRAELVQHKSNLSAVECERRQLQACVTEQNQRVRAETLEREEVTTQLELQRMQFSSLTKEHKELQWLHNCKNDEHEGVVLRLQSQLSSAHNELDKIRCTLRTLEGVDGHGLQVALDMQKEITARREQVDSLQGKIQHLEEKVEKLQQEKRYQNQEMHRQLQELTFIREEKRQLSNELKALRSKDLQLRERISELEAILHRMSESFANCQDFLQVREQEYFCLKLQHALDLKELQGQNLCTVPTESPPDLNSQTPCAQSAPPSSQHAYNSQIKSKKQQENSTCELRSLIRQLRGVISETSRPHADESARGSFHRRRSAPEKVHRTTFADDTEQVKARSRLRRKTFESEPRFLTNGSNGEIINNHEGRCISSPVTAAKFPHVLSLGRKSPVHTLLTSDPIS